MLVKEVIIIDGEEFVIEPTTEEDIPIIEKSKQEYERGEYTVLASEEDLDNEDNNN